MLFSFSVDNYTMFYQHPHPPKSEKWMGSESELIRDPDEPGVVPLDIVHLRDLRRAVSEQIGDLFRREGEERSVGLMCGGTA